MRLKCLLLDEDRAVSLQVSNFDLLYASEREPDTESPRWGLHLGYAALMREWHGLKRGDWDPFEEVLSNTLFTVEDADVGPSDGVPSPG